MNTKKALLVKLFRELLLIATGLSQIQAIDIQKMSVKKNECKL